MLTVEQLMQDRYEVIADYPGNNMAIGKIIQFDWHKENQRIELCHYYNKYPYIFRKLSWWEKREESDLPKYLKGKYTGQVLKVDSYTKTEGVYVVPNKKVEGDLKYTRIKAFLPATQSDFETFINKQTL